jgi:hypothetical protein
MSRQIIKQPNGKFAVWSNLVHNFITREVTAQEIVELYEEEERWHLAEQVLDICAQLDRNEKPYQQATLCWDDAVEMRLSRHGV